MIETGKWVTPGGKAVQLSYRPDTSDWNTLSSILTHDEYAMPRGRSGIAVDVGAHIGGWSVGMALDNPEMRVIAIEALPENVDLLRQNVQPLGRQVLALGRSASNKAGNETVAYGPDVTHRYIGDQRSMEGRAKVQLRTVTLEQVLKVAGGDIDLLKIDCEGCEFRFLDTPAVAQVREIVGEYHANFDSLMERLKPTHEVTFGSTGTQDTGQDFGMFRAVRR